MLAKVQKWGNSLALRLPKSLAEEADVHLDSPVEISVRDHAIVIEHVKRKASFSLDQLLDGVSPDNLHGEIGVDSPVGREVW